ncbi:MAG: hypothetical protein ACKODX_04210 [Gemmata sp.]
MSWKQVRSAGIGGALVVAVWATVALTAPAQFPDPVAPVRPGGFNPIELPGAPANDPEPLPPIVLSGSEIEQAQFRERPQPSGTTLPPKGNTPAPPLTATNVPDPPYPVVTIRVRVPADTMPGDDIKYTITVQNVSAADAHAVTVRNPLAAEVESVVRAEPEPDKAQSTAKQLIWALGTLKAGATRTIELTLRQKPNVTELKNLAYVKYEHGQAVTTKIGKPTVKVTKSAPKQTVRDETYTVRVQVENTGKVPAEGVRVLENLPASAEIEPVTAGAKRAQQAEGQQWVWEIAKLQPGERRVIEYRVTAREAKDVFTLTSVTGQKLTPDKPAEARTQVLVSGLDVKLTGPVGVVNAGEAANYEIVVRNTGTLPSTNLKVTGTIPADCKPTKKTEGGQLYRDSVAWTVPRLDPGEAQSFRYAVKASTTGRRVVAASASDARGTRGSQEFATTFAGVASLSWETRFDPLTVAVNKQGVFTVRVKNTGGESAREVRVRIDVPDNVSVVQTTPQVRVENNVLQFGAEEIRGFGELTYTITFEGKKADQAWFRVRMSADCLGDRPMQTEKMVEVIGGPK